MKIIIGLFIGSKKLFSAVFTKHTWAADIWHWSKVVPNTMITVQRGQRGEEKPGQVASINQISSVALHTCQLLSYPVSSWFTCQYLKRQHLAMPKFKTTTITNLGKSDTASKVGEGDSFIKPLNFIITHYIVERLLYFVQAISFICCKCKCHC